MQNIIQEPKLQIGWREWVSLPELGIPAIKAKIDTGARTSTLHAFLVETFQESGRQRVRFGVHPLEKRSDVRVFCIADLIDRRIVTDSGGHHEQRHVISTAICVGERQWPIEITLSNREEMRFRMLLGRTALDGLVIDPGASYCMGRSLAKEYEKLDKFEQSFKKRDL
ncbi:ATP-dependent zinc protease [Candidatus Acetothermia bacterium]|nr:ATP-dependent zinc protease [Candidatus Acetothermia bacterium]MBI3642742.1 ATP-dependent zinc protease [Candidatus Acetothermia bacterium]